MLTDLDIDNAIKYIQRNGKFISDAPWISIKYNFSYNGLYTILIAIHVILAHHKKYDKRHYVQ